MLYHFATIKQDIKLFEQATQKYEKATQINSEDFAAFNNWGNTLSHLAIMKKDGNILVQAFEKWEKACEINPNFTYAVSCIYASYEVKEGAFAVFAALHTAPPIQCPKLASPFSAAHPPPVRLAPERIFIDHIRQRVKKISSFVF